ncbi:MAG TPA: dihydrodipicolinate synthase family protein [Acidimicrobiales bacterium]|nr:dihydrodipicolinate synthase family protein [Acidimicrobiales bacterium]
MSITPFTPRGAIDEAALRAHLRFLADAGVGIYLCSQGSGEGDLMTHEERLRVYEIGVDEIKGRVPVYAAGVGLAHSTERIVALARGASAIGVDAVYVLGPRPGALAPRPAEIEAYYREVIEAITRPVVISNNAALAGYSFSVDLIERLASDYPHVREVLIADNVGPLMTQVSRLAASLGDRLVIRVGMSNQSLLAYSLGAHGILNFEANIAPRLTEGVWTALHAGDMNLATERFARFMRLNLLCSHYGNPRVIKAALAVLGRDGGALRKPYLPLTDAEYAEFAPQLRALELPSHERY